MISKSPFPHSEDCPPPRAGVCVVEAIAVPDNAIHVEGVPEPPEGTEISHIDVVVHVVTKDRSSPL